MSGIHPKVGRPVAELLEEARQIEHERLASDLFSRPGETVWKMPRDARDSKQFREVFDQPTPARNGIDPATKEAFEFFVSDKRFTALPLVCQLVPDKQSSTVICHCFAVIRSAAIWAAASSFRIVDPEVAHAFALLSAKMPSFIVALRDFNPALASELQFHLDLMRRFILASPTHARLLDIFNQVAFSQWGEP
jgi:hypothetical protein